MTNEILVLQFLWQVGRARLAALGADERGEVTEKVIIVAIFAALAISAGAIIVSKVTARANSIPTE